MTARILVIEDEPRIAGFLARGLGREGHDVVIAEDGDVGLFLALSEPVDVVVLDLSLPGRSGLEVLTELRRQRPDLPVLMLTGHDDPRSRAACLDAGASGFATKPLVFAEFRREVARQLSGGG